MSDLKRTVLHDLHLTLGARMVPFAGYHMPVQYPMGVLREHLQTRAGAGLFDVSHMGQVLVAAKSGSMRDAALALERLVPVDVAGLQPGRQRYAMFTNGAGGIEDDLMIANRGDHFLLVVNAARKDADLALLMSGLPDCDAGAVQGRSLLALQGPVAETALAALVPDVAEMAFMDVAIRGWRGAELWISRSGYSGEDGFEISVSDALAVPLAEALLAQPGVVPAGLGARDSLRLEAGLCLYGHDIDDATTPVEAGLAWAVQKVRRAGGARAGGFPGAARILSQFADGAPRLRVGLRPDGRAPMREGTPLFALDGTPVGQVTSGGFGPSVDLPIAMGYVVRAHAAEGAALLGDVRGRRLPVTVAAMPFHPTSYKPKT